MLLDNHYAPDRRVAFEGQLLRDGGAQVRIIAWDRRAEGSLGSIRSQQLDDGTELVRLEVPAAHGDGLGSIRRLGRLMSLLLKHRKTLLADVDVLVCHDIYLLPIGVLLSRLAQVALVYDAHEDFAAMAGARYPAVLLRSVEHIETLLARRASHVVVPGESRSRRWERVGITPLVLPNTGLDQRPGDGGNDLYDVVYCGILTEARRLDLLIDLARKRPDLRIAAAGQAGMASELEQASAELPNLTFLGWHEQPDELLASARVIYYGLDPQHPYASLACPNNLYQALRVGRPLLFFCGGEPEALLERFDIGRRCSPEVAQMSDAVDDLVAGRAGREVSAAWEWVTSRAERHRLRYREALLSAGEA